MTRASGWLVIAGFGIHVGGGRVLQEALVGQAGNGLAGLVADQRFVLSSPVAPDAWVKRVAPSIPARLASLWRLADRVTRGQVLLCFNGLPPLRRSRATTIAYIQSTHFVGGDRGMRYPLRVRVRQALDRALFRFGRRNLDAIWVQTPTIAAAMRRVAGDVPVHVRPFTAMGIQPLADAHAEPAVRADGRFLYPADGARHKNHAALLRAWALLEGSRATLTLTLGPSELHATLSAAGMTHLPEGVVNAGPLPQVEIVARFTAGEALVFPSLTETVGLPLLEAAAAGAVIVASELDFVRDVAVPDQTFDPRSPRSIARAVHRAMGEAEPPIGIASASAIIEALCEARRP